jgi:hypothetical protein
MAVNQWSTTAADNDDADSTINWLEGQSPATVNDSARAMMAAIASWYALIDAGTVSGGTVGGTADAITLTCSPTVSALAAGQRYLFKYTSTGNTGAVTLNVDSLGATAVRYKDVALVSGDIATSDWVLVVYDGTRFQMLNPPRLSWATTDVPTDTTGGAVADLFLFADASESNALNKVTLQKMLDNALTGLTADTIPDVADSLLTYDASGTAAKTTTITNFYKTINTLTADATPDGAADYIPTYDASVSGAKKILIQSMGATAAQQETGTAATNFVTPSVQHRHQSAAKAWLSYDQSSGTATLSSPSYNVSSITDGATGIATINWTTAFSTAVYSHQAACKSNSGAANAIMSLSQSNSQNKSTTAMPVTTRYSSTDAAQDSPDVNISVFGDQ